MDAPEQWEALLAHTQDKIIVLDEEGRLRYANEAVERILGYDTDSLLGENVFALIHPDDRERVEAHFASLVDASETATDTVEYRCRAADGSWVWLESRMSNRTDSVLGGYVVSSRDVSERKQMESERAELEARLLQITENAEDVLWMFTADWEELLYVNSAYENIWGYSTESLRENPQEFLCAIHPDDRERVEAAMERLSAGESIDVEYRVSSGGAHDRRVWVKGSPVIEDGEVIRVAGFARDVTERRIRERQLQNMDRVLRHNLRTDLNLVMGYAERAREWGDPDVVAEMDKLLARVDSMVATAEKERKIVTLLSSDVDPRSVNLHPVVTETVKRIREEYPTADVTVNCPEETTVSAIPSLSTAIRELVENAIEHADDAPTVTVSVTPTNDHVEIAVSDRNPSIPDQEVEILLEQNEVGQLYHGNGLGLELAYWIVRFSDGRISFAENQPRGNVITVTLSRP